MKTTLVTLLTLLIPIGAGAAESMTELLSGSARDNFGWTFDNGSEFPGATGKLSSIRPSRTTARKVFA